MEIIVKLEEFDDDLFMALPEEALAHLKASVGDTLELLKTPNGLLLKPLITTSQAE